MTTFHRRDRLIRDDGAALVVDPWKLVERSKANDAPVRPAPNQYRFLMEQKTLAKIRCALCELSLELRTGSMRISEVGVCDLSDRSDNDGGGVFSPTAVFFWLDDVCLIVH